MNPQKISKSELALGLTAGFFYLCALYALVTRQYTLLLFFFLLHSLICIVFFLVSQEQIFRAALDNPESSRLEEELREDLSQCEKELADAKNSQTALSRENDLLTQKIAELETAAAMPAVPASPAEVKNPLLPNTEKRQTFDLAALAASIVRRFQHQSSDKQIRMQVSTSGEPVMITADPDLVTILFHNIIDNALKYISRGDSLFITLSGMGNQIFLVFKDNGPGVSSEEASHLFDLNYQGANRVNGSGLGLTQVKAIIDHLGGSIEAKSGTCPGLALYIQLPADGAADTQEETA